MRRWGWFGEERGLAALQLEHQPEMGVISCGIGPRPSETRDHHLAIISGRKMQSSLFALASIRVGKQSTFILAQPGMRLLHQS